MNSFETTAVAQLPRRLKTDDAIEKVSFVLGDISIIENYLIKILLTRNQMYLIL